MTSPHIAPDLVLSSESQAILNQIDHILSQTPPSTIQATWFGDDFGRLYLEYEKTTNQMSLIAEKMADLICQKIEAMPHQQLCIGSLGCGDGELDYMILSQVVKQHPDAIKMFVGTDINDTLCKWATKRLDPLPFEVVMICEDLSHMQPDNLPKFDFLYMVHVLTLLPSLHPAVERVAMLIPETTFAMVSAPRAAHTQLFLRFWYHEQRGELWHTHLLLPVLQEYGLSYKMERLTAQMDFTRFFEDKFESSFSQEMLTWMCHTWLEYYPAELRELAIQYIDSIATGQPNNYLVPHSCDFLIFQKKS
jgi:hypothetical protein